MTVVHLCIGAFFPDGYSYQENMLPKYHKMLGYNTYVIAGLDVFDENGKVKFISAGKSYIGDYDIPVTRLNFKGNLKTAKKLKNYQGLEAKLNELKPDIIFIHNCQFICISDVVKYLKKHPKTKVYVDNHADFSNSATNWVSKNLLHKMLWKSCAKKIEPYATKFYGVLPARVDFLKNIYGMPANKCELLVMGADDEAVEKAAVPEVKAEIRKKYNIADDDFLIMTGGKIDKFKTQTLLLMDAVNNINNPKVKLIVFGSVTQELKADVEKRCSENVQYIGWQKSEDSYPLFASCDLACFPGRHSVFWEQVTGQGIPMLVKKWDGTTHVDLGGNVHFLTKDSVAEIQGEIEDLLNNPEKFDKMKKIAVENGMKVFSYKNIAERSIEV